MSRARTLKALGAALQGRLAPDVDWMQLLELANRAMVSPSLARPLEAGGVLAEAPPDAAALLVELAARSEARNQRLAQMAAEAIGALNAAGIEPVLMKGMALWASLPAGAPFSRLMSDIDLLVAPAQVDQAIAALEAAGFPVLARYTEASSHVAAELGRSSDVGAIDLHRRAPGPPAMVMAFDPQAHTVAMAWRGRVRVPSPAHQIYLLCLHDQFHDTGYWRGGFDLRHLHDIAELSRLGVDWAALEAAAPTRLVRNAVNAELVAAHEIAGAEIPKVIRRNAAARFHYRRHLAQHLYPRARLLLAGLGLLTEAPNVPGHRAVNRSGWRTAQGGGEAAPDRRWGFRPSRIRGLMKMRGGKI